MITDFGQRELRPPPAPPRGGAAALELQQPSMRILYGIFVLCVGALLFTALAAARHIRRHEDQRKAALEDKTDSPPERTSAVEVLEPARGGRRLR
jgi:hypothetical protein